jgi:ABC-type Fe3+/spermidine/putrescine transport system ATPase subunit
MTQLVSPPTRPAERADSATAYMRVSGLDKTFGKVHAVNDISFEVRSGEFLTLLGPSGCGKSTTLRLIAGLERPDSGEIEVEGRVVTSPKRGVFVPPEKRAMGMVFQSYAVWPHMTVFENVAFPLRVRRRSAAEVRQRVTEVLNTIGLDGMADRPAPDLSGGQQQRVALGRALVSDPRLLLLDEPFSNLDARLREGMRVEMGQLQRRLGLTTIFVTHDQTEAMMLSDRIFVMNGGRVEQVGSPRDVYEHPASRFVMDFLGRINYLAARVVRRSDGMLGARLTDGTDVAVSLPDGLSEGRPVTLAFRSADVELAPQSDGTGWPAVVQTVAYMGGREEYLLKMAGDAEIKAERATTNLMLGTPVGVHVPPQKIRAWPD